MIDKYGTKDTRHFKTEELGSVTYRRHASNNKEYETLEIDISILKELGFDISKTWGSKTHCLFINGKAYKAVSGKDFRTP